MPAPFKPSGYSAVSPYLVVKEAGKVLDFLKNTFEARELRRIDKPGGTIIHAEVQIGDSVVMIGSAGLDWAAAPSHVHVYVEDVDVCYSRAIDFGGVSVQAPESRPGDPNRRGGVKDPTGNTWWIATLIEHS